MSNPLYGRITACKDWRGTIRDFLSEEWAGVCVGGVTSLDKSVFFWTQQGFGHGYGKEFRVHNTTNLDKGIFKAHEAFYTSEQRGIIGIAEIRVVDLLISGSGMYIWYIPVK